ncbi:MAG TPA: hypothetical protein VM287_08525 [Egibacteraceae bacterium]|jgi:hypothetical protein|nr:hypothetical protein [Egibacteraceae bacterium]
MNLARLSTIKERRTFALLGIAFWVFLTLVLLVTIRLMSLDEEWRGWSDAVPLLLLYSVITAVLSGAVWLLLRTRQSRA